jgi:hypothetical protein
MLLGLSPAEYHLCLEFHRILLIVAYGLEVFFSFGQLSPMGCGCGFKGRRQGWQGRPCDTGPLNRRHWA